MMSLPGIIQSLRATRAVVATIDPMVDHSREKFGTIHPQVWGQPYIVGFLSTLITLVAMQKTRGRLQGEQLGNTQVKAWMAITGIPDAQIGEDICILSANSDADFVTGCQNASRFVAAYNGASSMIYPAPDDVCWDDSVVCLSETDEHLRVFGSGGDHCAALWNRYFEVHL